ncbi:MAG: response regulator [Candidatus Abyssobacteria bacterium SURF_17]|uniref:Response regulator n=1 Tax=Candidatus Abyssobacteria bacterium SURF_17 TaxID=2093361 RepID=A0A419F3W1_9BACT|nr:MAG: response regulator [Candidatus Abyssubacteria bacterium SURF_17]
MKGHAKIVVFDPDTEARGATARCLIENDWEVIPVSSFAETMETLKQGSVDIVLLDADINELRGVEIIREAKARNPEVSIILTGTQHSVEKNPNMLMFAGYEYVAKPIHRDAICSAIEQRLNQQHLYRVCSALSVTLKVDTVLSILLESALQEVGADQAAVLLRDGPPDVLRLTAAKGFPDGCLGAACAVDDSSIVGLALMTNEPIVLQGGFARLPFVPDDVSREVSSSICAPIRIGGKTLGLLNINRLNHTRPFCQSEVRTVEILALQTAVAIQNAREHHHALERHRLRQELEFARSIQQSLLPAMTGYERFAEVAARSIPANVIGGDFFDFVELAPAQCGILIGDVAGKGIPGALLMVRTISNFRLRARPEQEPGEVLEQLNNELVRGKMRGVYVTAIYAVLDFAHGTLRFANAGHPPFFMLRGSSPKADCSISSAGIPLGIESNSSFETAELSFKSGDLAFFYTDGIIEAKNPHGEQFSLARLENAVETFPRRPETLVIRVLGEVTAFTAPGSHHDDLTLLAVKTNYPG